MRFLLPGRNRSVRSVIVESKKIQCFLSGLKFLFLFFLLFSAESSLAQITNNNIVFTNGLHGVICATPDENDSAVLTAPAGTVFTNVNFASYGTPNGDCSLFSINSSCNAA